MGATKNNTGGHLKIRGTGKNSNKRGHTKFLGGLKNRGGKAFRGPVIEGCNNEHVKFDSHTLYQTVVTII